MFGKALSYMHKHTSGIVKKKPYDSVGANLLHTAEVAAAAEGFGYLHGRYREEASIKGVPLNLVAGLGLKAVVLGAGLLSRGSEMPGWASHVDAVALAGLGSYMFADGVARGTKAAGRSIFILESGAARPKDMGGLKQTDVVGALPQAVGGAYLSADDLRAARRQK